MSSATTAMLKNWKNGISVLVAAQDDHLTLKDSVESLMVLGDEVIVVTNQATEETLLVANELGRSNPETVAVVHLGDVSHLYENRQAGLMQAQYRWIVRADADYIAYDDSDGARSVASLRQKVLRITPLWPTALYLTKVCLSMGWGSMYDPANDDQDGLCYIPRVYTAKSEPRIYLRTPFLRFQRLGRWEGVPGLRWYRKIRIRQPYWFEVTLRSERSLFLRTARTDWREYGDFGTYPTVERYAEDVVIPNYYPGLTLDEAAAIYVRDQVLPKIRKYDEARFFPLPARIRSKTPQ